MHPLKHPETLLRHGVWFGRLAVIGGLYAVGSVELRQGTTKQVGRPGFWAVQCDDESLKIGAGGHQGVGGRAIDGQVLWDMHCINATMRTSNRSLPELFDSNHSFLDSVYNLLQLAQQGTHICFCGPTLIMARWRSGYPAPESCKPHELFAITNPSSGYPTCIGEAVTYGRRCKRTVAGDKVSVATQLVGQLAEISPSAAAKSSAVGSIASHMLCWQHTHQHGQIVEGWKQALLDRAETEDECQSTKSSQPKCRKPEDDDIESLASGIRILQEELRRMKAAKETGSRMRFSFDFSFDGAWTRASGRADAEAHSDGTDKAKEKAREQQRQEDAERKRQTEEQERKRKAKERLEKLKEDARRKAQAAKLAEEQKWSNAWTRYNDTWKAIEEGRCTPSKLPWPTLSGEASNLTEAGVREFYRRGPPASEDRFRLFSQETKRWHTDKLLSRFGKMVFDGAAKEDLDLVTRVTLLRWKEARLGR